MQYKVGQVYKYDNETLTILEVNTTHLIVVNDQGDYQATDFCSLDDHTLISENSNHILLSR